MVLHLGDDDLVAFLHEGLTKAGGNEVDALRGATSEDDFAGRAGIDETADGLACLLVEVCSLLGEEVYATVDVGIHVVVLLGHGFYHLTRLLCRSGIVEIHESVLVVYLSP